MRDRTADLNKISVFSCTFKFHELRSFGHFIAQFIDNLIVPAIEKVFHIFFKTIPIGLVGLTNGMRLALPEMIIKTDLVGWVGAFFKGKETI